MEPASIEQFAPHALNLVIIGLLGFVGVPRARFEQMAQAVTDDARRSHPLVVQYIGWRREAVMRHPSIFEWAR